MSDITDVLRDDDPLYGLTEEQRAAVEAQIRAAKAGSESHVKALKRDLRLMDKEIAIATADYACNKGRWERYEEVRKEYEAEWVANNKAALDAWKSSREAEG